MITLMTDWDYEVSQWCLSQDVTTVMPRFPLVSVWIVSALLVVCCGLNVSFIYNTGCLRLIMGLGTIDPKIPNERHTSPSAALKLLRIFNLGLMIILSTKTADRRLRV
jgi:hypothetical protein